MMGWNDYGGVGAGGWIAMIVAMALFWGLVIVAGAWILRGLGKSRGNADTRGGDEAPDRDPVSILDERFARGDIDHDDYQARRAALLDSKG